MERWWKVRRRPHAIHSKSAQLLRHTPASLSLTHTHIDTIISPWFGPVLTHIHRSDGHAWPVFTLNKLQRDCTQTNKQHPRLAPNTLFLIGFHTQQTFRFHQNAGLSSLGWEMPHLFWAFHCFGVNCNNPFLPPFSPLLLFSAGLL